MNSPAHSPHLAAWPAPVATRPLDAVVQLPGSKSLTNRELLLAAIADGPGRLERPLRSRDATIMADALRSLGARIDDVPGDGRFGPDLIVTPGPITGGVSIDCGLAGTAMRFLPILAALGTGPVTFDGDPAARVRPMRTTIDSLRALGVRVDDGGRGTLPFTVHGTGGVAGGAVTIDASASSQFVSALVLAAPRFEHGIELTHEGAAVPSIPHIEMTIAALVERGVDARATGPSSWHVRPGPIAARTVRIEPDLSNAAPFLAAALVAGGRVSIDGWPDATTQVGALVPELLERLGAATSVGGGVASVDGGQGVRGGATLRGGTIDLSMGGELAPTIAVLGAFCDEPLTITGIGHIRGHETDRVAALITDLARLGCTASGDDALTIEPAALHGGTWRAFEDHRIATSGALLGLVTDGVEVDDIGATAKTIPEFPELWQAMLA